MLFDQPKTFTITELLDPGVGKAIVNYPLSSLVVRRNRNDDTLRVFTFADYGGAEAEKRDSISLDVDQADALSKLFAEFVRERRAVQHEQACKAALRDLDLSIGGRVGALSHLRP